ncbi:MAG: carboxypeptidase-like regulatory domain-containing protein [Planctomycetota bacterium]
MKILGLIVIGLILVVLLVGYCLWPLHDGSGSAPDNVLATRPSTERAITSPETNPAHPGTVVSPKPPGKTPPSSGIPSQEDRIAKDWKMREETADRANVPIAFYGKVVDQNGEVVKGVTVKMHIRTETALGPPGGKNLSATTDAEGMFKVSDERGKVLFVESFEKKGYQPPKNERAFDYFGVSGPRKGRSPDNPVVFRLWKMRGAEYLMKGRYGKSIDYGELTLIDLTTCKKVKDGGDIQIVIDRTPREMSSGDRSHYDWGFSIEVINGGGLLEGTDEFMNDAPADGYAQKIIYEVKKDDPDWDKKCQVHRQYYVKFRNGSLYGKISLRWSPYGSGFGGGDMEVWINPSGSRNLEYDPAVQEAHERVMRKGE